MRSRARVRGAHRRLLAALLQGGRHANHFGARQDHGTRPNAYRPAGVRDSRLVHCSDHLLVAVRGTGDLADEPLIGEANHESHE
jgi:hypothetical protein